MNSRKFWENFILVAIILVIIQTFLDEFSVYRHWSVSTRNILLCTALFFDFLFSVEFTVRSILSHKKGSASQYWMYERGWVDFLSSFPLLLLNSGPAVLLLFLGDMDQSVVAISVFNILKVVKAIRVTRILRLIRIIKIFGKIQNAESPMAQHHTSAIATIAVFTMICTLVLFSIITTSPADQRTIELKDHYNGSVKTIKDLKMRSRMSHSTLIKKTYSNDKNVIKVLLHDKKILSNIKEEQFKEYYTADDYMVVKAFDISIFISLVDINKHVAYWNMMHFFIIIFTVLSFMIVYTRHFAQNISDLIHVMNKGFRKKNYNLQVKMREEYKDDEVFQLARFYNDAYLPAKLRKIQKEEKDTNKSAGISMDFLKDFKDK